MPWYAISTLPGQEERLCEAMKAAKHDKPDCFSFFMLPARKIWMKSSKEKVLRAVGMVFVETDDVNDIRDIRLHIRMREHIRMTLLYDVFINAPLVIPEKQMAIFQRQNPDFVDEVVVLSHPFAGYASKNTRFFVMDGPFAGMEGYKIDLHREKKLAISFGNMALALNKLYQYKIVRVIEPEKEPIFRYQQRQRIVSGIIGSLQVHGFADDAYKILGIIIEKCHEADDSIVKLEKELPDNCSYLKKYLRSLDAFTAGQIEAVTSSIYSSETAAAEWSEALQPRRMLPFLTPTSGRMDAATTKDILIEHDGFKELIRRVTIQERVPDGDITRSKNKKVEYYAHLEMLTITDKDGTASRTKVSVDFSPFTKHFHSLSNLQRVQELIKLEQGESPLYDFLKTSDELSATIDTDTPTQAMLTQAAQSILPTAIGIIENLLHTPRLAVWRKILPEVIIHNQ